MPITFKTDRSKDLTVFTATGDVIYEEIINAFNSYIEAAQTDYVLLNFLNGTGKTVTFEQMKLLIEKGRSPLLRKPWKTAIVVSSEIGFRMARIYQGLTEVEKTPQKAKVFRSMEDAYEWLNIPQEESEK